MNKKSDTDKGQNQANINWYPGHMAKTKRIIKEKYDQIDIVYELVDSRIPFSSKIKGLDSLIKNKPKILIMTKSDLCDINETKKWMKYYEEKEYKVLLLNLNTGNDYKKIIETTNEMMKDLQAKRLAKGLKEKELRALVIGIPNVGKSTLINKMAGKKVANVGNNPGVTKSLTWLNTNSNILLLDSPGILWPKFDNSEIALNLSAMTAIKNEVLPIDEVAIHILNKLNKYYPAILKSRYKIDNIDDDIIISYDKIGKACGCIITGGEVDYDRVSQLIVNDIKKEHIKGITFDRSK